ncbi:MAG: alkaline phosphatase family protein, partial [Bacteroidia bacterium]|nr:alkaline phosphatase family protein [Bacteroidia bacterium]
MKKIANPTVYIDDVSPFRTLPRSPLRQIAQYTKQILRILRSSIIAGSTPTGFKYNDEFSQNEHRGFPVTLIVKESYEDYRVQSSREALVFNSITKANPALLFSYKSHPDQNEIEFSVFLNKQANRLNSISISGYMENKTSKRQRFDFYLDRKTISGFAKPTYWIDVGIALGDAEYFVEGDVVDVYLDNMTFDERIVSKKATDRYIVSSELDQGEPEKKKQILILSFDGITSDDIFNNQEFEKLFPNLRVLMDGNCWFKNAITSSTVTASSAASLVTGLNLPQHYIFNYEDFYLSPGLKAISPYI